MHTKLSSAVLAVIGVASLSIAVPLSAAKAQEQPAAPPAQETKAEPGQVTDATAPKPAQEARGELVQGFPIRDARPAVAAPGGQVGRPVPSQNLRRDLAPMSGQPMPQYPQAGPPATMIADGNFLYVLRGDQVFKLNKGDLRVVAMGMLPNGMAQMVPGAPPFRDQRDAPAREGGRIQGARPADAPRRTGGK